MERQVAARGRADQDAAAARRSGDAAASQRPRRTATTHVPNARWLHLLTYLLDNMICCTNTTSSTELQVRNVSRYHRGEPIHDHRTRNMHRHAYLNIPFPYRGRGHGNKHGGQGGPNLPKIWTDSPNFLLSFLLGDICC